MWLKQLAQKAIIHPEFPDFRTLFRCFFFKPQIVTLIGQEATHELSLGHGALCTMEGQTQRCRANGFGFLEHPGGNQEFWRKAGPFFTGLDDDIHIRNHM